MRSRRICVPLRAASHSLMALLLAVSFSGCRERPTTVTGRITVDGTPLTLPADSRGTIVFQPAGGRGTVAAGLLDSTGHFKLAIGSSSEVPPGNYYVTVSVAKLLPPAEGQERGAELITPPRYASAQQSGLEATVKPGENVLSFDLDSRVPAEGAANTQSATTENLTELPADEKSPAPPAGEQPADEGAREEPSATAPSNDASKQ